VHKSKVNITIPNKYAIVTGDNDITLKMIQKLPNKYVFKASHRSAMTVIVNNNSFIRHGYCIKPHYNWTSQKAQHEFLKKKSSQ
jgi:hypothetical protein